MGCYVGISSAGWKWSALQATSATIGSLQIKSLARWQLGLAPNHSRGPQSHESVSGIGCRRLHSAAPGSTLTVLSDLLAWGVPLQHLREVVTPRRSRQAPIAQAMDSANAPSTGAPLQEASSINPLTRTPSPVPTPAHTQRPVTLRANKAHTHTLSLPPQQPCRAGWPRWPPAT